MASKQQMARELVSLGHAKTFNTLRQWSAERLESELETMKRVDRVIEQTQEQLVDTELQARVDSLPVAVVAPPIPMLPLVPDGYSTAIVVPAPRIVPNVRPARRWQDWLMLALQPLVTLRMIIGV